MVERVERRGSWVFSSTMLEVPVRRREKRLVCSVPVFPETLLQVSCTELDDYGQVLLHVCGHSSSLLMEFI